MNIWQMGDQKTASNGNGQTECSDIPIFSSGRQVGKYYKACNSTNLR